MGLYEFYDEFRLEVLGSGPEMSDLDHAYFYFRSNNPTSDIDIRCRTGSIETYADEKLGDPTENFSRNASDFIVNRYGGGWAVNRTWDDFVLSPDIRDDRVRMLIEFGLRERYIEENFSLVHASAAKIDRDIILMPAWRHAGKTNSLLSLLESGADYLADDRLWVSDDGDVRALPSKIHLAPHNHRGFPQFADSPVDRLRSELSNRVSDVVQSRSSTVALGVKLLNDWVLSQSDWVPPEKLYPNTEVVTEGTVDRLVLLVASDQPSPELDEISEAELRRALYAINFYEWDRDLLELSMAHDVLFPERESKERRVRRLVSEDHDVLSSLVSSVQCQRLLVPQRNLWTDEMKRDIVDALRRGP